MSIIISEIILYYIPWGKVKYFDSIKRIYHYNKIVIFRSD